MTAPLVVPKLPRIGYLESIRGLAAVQVLLLHFLAGFAPDLVYSLPAAGAVAGYIHLSPLYFLYDGYSAVYIFFALSGYVLTRSFERNLVQPWSQVLARMIRLGVPALAATLVAAAVMLAFGKPNLAAGELSVVMCGSVSSTPPGACALAVTIPSTQTTVSSPKSSSCARPSSSPRTTCARPPRSRMIRKETRANRRRRWTHP